MSATAIAQAAIKYAPQAISVAKDLIAKIAPQAIPTLETVTQVATLATDSGYSQTLMQAKDLISSDTNIANKLFGLSAHLHESHPEIALKFESYASKLLNKIGLSDEEISFLHKHITNISSTETEAKPEAPKSEPTAEDIHILINLLAKGELDPSREAAYIKTLNNQTAIPLKEVKQLLIDAAEKHHPTEQIEEPQTTINNTEAEQSSSVSILDGSLTDAQQKVVLEASKKIPITIQNEKLSDIVKKSLPEEGTQRNLAEKEPFFFKTLTKIASGKALSLTDYKATVSSLLSAFGISLENQNEALNNLHTQHAISINQASPKENTEAQIETPSSESKASNTSSTHLDSLVANIRDVLVREVKGSSTLFGMAQRAVGAAKGIGIPLPQSLQGMEDIGKVLDKLVLTDSFKSSLEQSIKGEKVNFQGDNELQTRAFQIINWGVWSINKLPKVAIEYFPLAVNALKWAMPVARFIPIIGGVLCTAYPILDEVAKVIDKFQVEAENIRTACTAIKGERTNNTEATSEAKTETVKSPEPELAEARV